MKDSYLLPVTDATGREFDLTAGGEILVQEAPHGEPVFGWCPLCGAPGLYRQITPGSKDGCVNGHAYWSASARREPPAL